MWSSGSIALSLSQQVPCLVRGIVVVITTLSFSAGGFQEKTGVVAAGVTDPLPETKKKYDFWFTRLPRMLRVTPAEFYHIDKTTNGFMNPNYAQNITAWSIQRFHKA